MKMLDVSKSPALWYDELFENSEANDFIFFYENDDDYIWFITQFTQYLCRELVETEVAPIFGRHIRSLKAFLYQLNFSLPCGFRYGIKYKTHALYDLALNFETEPKRRLILWNDADYLFESRNGVFIEIFDVLVVAAYCNRKGIATDDFNDEGRPYQVDQRNLFFFQYKFKEKVEDFIAKQRVYIPPLAKEQHLEFNLFVL